MNIKNNLLNQPIWYLGKSNDIHLMPKFGPRQTAPAPSSSGSTLQKAN